MDKGLIRIQELEQNLKQLEIKKEENDKERFKLIAEDTRLDTRIYNMDQEIQKLNRDKSQSEVAPTKRKGEKKSLIIALILSYIIVALLSSLTVGVAISATSILNCIGATTLLIGTIFGITLPIEFKNINKKYPIGNLAEIAKNISISDAQLQFLTSKKQELNTEITNLTEIKYDLESQINEIVKKINSINYLRANVIEEFCKDNIELEKKLDDAYNKFEVKQKVK